MKQTLALAIAFLTYLVSPLLGADHALFSQILKAHVEADQVDYKGLKQREESSLDKYLKQLELTRVEELDRPQKLAFYINAYNAATLKLILNHYPLKSINDISAPERWKWKGWKVGGALLSLDEIEHVKLRPMKEPRIHFAINCASVSCPLLVNQAYEAETLEAQLESATKAFFEDELRGFAIVESTSFFGGSKKDIYVSKLFSWFGMDFVDESGSILPFVKTYAPAKYKEELDALESADDLEFLDYDWNLNGK